MSTQNPQSAYHHPIVGPQELTFTTRSPDMLTCVNWLEYVRYNSERGTVDRYAAAIASAFYDNLDLRGYQFADHLSVLTHNLEWQNVQLRGRKSSASTPMTPEEYRGICTNRRLIRETTEQIKKLEDIRNIVWRKFVEDQTLDHRHYRLDKARADLHDAENSLQVTQKRLLGGQKEVDEARAALTVAQKAFETDPASVQGLDSMDYAKSRKLPRYH